MPFRNFETLQSWLEEFRQLGYEFEGGMKVIPQDGAHGANTGLVAVTLTNHATVVTIEPNPADVPRWDVTIERGEGPVTLDAPELLGYAAELSVISALCAFLEAKSLAYLGIDSA